MIDPDLLASIGLEFCSEGTAITCVPCRFAVAAAAPADKLQDCLRDRHHLGISQRRAAVEYAQHLYAEAGLLVYIIGLMLSLRVNHILKHVYLVKHICYFNKIFKCKDFLILKAS